MKKAGLLLILVTILMIGLMAGVFIGRRMGSVTVSVNEMRNADPSVPSATNANVTGKININTANLQQLSMLPGIGDTIAQRIIDYRDLNGNYQTIDELMFVDGIGEKRLEEITPYITTGG